MSTPQRKLLNIVVASPGDVQAERDALEKVVADLNQGVAAVLKLRLELVRWETDAYPGFHPEGPQGLIDSILGIEDCDILIGLFWTRFGTPTKDAKSGTEHEIRKAYTAWQKTHRPQIMVYFNQKSYTPQSSKETEQWGRVLKFKEDFPDEGLYWEYDEGEFEDLVRKHLTQHIRDRYELPGRASKKVSGNKEEKSDLIEPTHETIRGESGADESSGEEKSDLIEQPLKAVGNPHIDSEHRYAVLIGNSTFPTADKLQPLQAPEHDVDDLKAILKLPDRGQFDEPIMLKNQPHYEAEKEINRTLGKARENDFVLIYYSGHGKLNRAGDLYLASHNTDLDALEATSISTETIKKYIEVSRCKQIVLILDCCFSGTIGEVSHRGSVDDRLQLLSKVRSTFIMTSATKIQTATEKKGDRHGVFTKHMISGIRSGEADRNGDGLITMDELYDHVYEKVRQESSQEPMKWGMNVSGTDLVIAKSGRQPRFERAQEIRALLLDLANENRITDAILATALIVIKTPVDQLTNLQRRRDQLLDELRQQSINPAEFVSAWAKIGTEALPEDEKKTNDSRDDNETPESSDKSNAPPSEPLIPDNGHDGRWFIQPWKKWKGLRKLVITQLILIFPPVFFLTLALTWPQAASVFLFLCVVFLLFLYVAGLLLSFLSWKERFWFGIVQGLPLPLAATVLGFLLSYVLSLTFSELSLNPWNSVQNVGFTDGGHILVSLSLIAIILLLGGWRTLIEIKNRRKKEEP